MPHEKKYKELFGFHSEKEMLFRMVTSAFDFLRLPCERESVLGLGLQPLPRGGAGLRELGGGLPGSVAHLGRKGGATLGRNKRPSRWSS